MTIEITTFRENFSFTYNVLVEDDIPLMPSITIKKKEKEVEYIDNEEFIWKVIGDQTHELSEYDKDFFKLLDLVEKYELDPYSRAKKAVKKLDTEFLDKFFRKNSVSDFVKQEIYEFIEAKANDYKQLEDYYNE